MKQIITKDQAYKMYLESGMEELMPFNSPYEPNYLEWLRAAGYVIIDTEEITL